MKKPPVLTKTKGIKGFSSKWLQAKTKKMIVKPLRPSEIGKKR